MQHTRSSRLALLLLLLSLVVAVPLIRAVSTMPVATLQATLTAPAAVAAVSATPTPRPTLTELPPTYTPLPPTTPPTASPTYTRRPTNTPTATPTPVPSATPPATPTPYATLSEQPPITQPTPVPLFPRPDHVVNIALLGNDVGGTYGGRTDSIVIVSIDEQNGTATMLSLPRDLYVVVPGWRMTRINQALPHGNVADYPGKGGGMFADTVAYNFGIPIDYYLRIGFDGFKRVVDALGGVSVAVTCQIRDWRLIEPDLDPEVEENWEMVTLEPGLYYMDGDLALWYVRSRRSSNDFDRGRRQQQVLRAILNRGLDLDLLSSLPELWATYQDEVETNMTLPLMIRLATLAPEVRVNGVQHLYFPPAALRAWTTPGGGSVQRLQWEAAAPVLGRLMEPPLLHSSSRPPFTVEVVTPYDVHYRLAAEMLAWYGFVPVRGEPVDDAPAYTQAVYYGSTFKGSYHWLLAWTLGVNSGEVVLDSTPGANVYDYRVILSRNYDSCRNELEGPLLTGER